MRKAVPFLIAAAFAALALGATAQEKSPKPPAKQPVPAPATPATPPPGGAAPAPPADQKPPKLVIEKLEFDAGAVSKGQSVEAVFEVANKGEGLLQILRVQPACGCTVPSFDKEIAPGKTGQIKASVNTAAFSGPITKTVSVFTNDAAMGTFQLTIKADVKAILSVSLPQKNADGTESLVSRETEQLGLVFKGQAAERDFVIKSEDGAPFQITQVQTEDNNIRYQVIPAKDKLSAHFKVTVPADYPVGPITGRFTLSTSHPKVPTLNVNVFGTIREPLMVYPKEVVFNGLSKDYIAQNPEDAALNKLVTVSFETGPELTVTSAKSSDPALQVTYEATAPNQRYSVKIHLDAKTVKVGEFNAKVTVETNKQTIVIPVSGRIF